ncbi:hypothetical protein [Psychroserpens mesophilus]|uniref:hypothetical protein n=1 Tax=Psychroserpens mesophilus TaxID=325473 RepID=UPI00058D542C|nr:hypothetical protein [Psychroserpens mesophilus]
MKKLIYIFLAICFYSNAQKKELTNQKFKKTSDSLIISVINNEYYENYFKTKSITYKFVEYSILIDVTEYKKIKIFFDDEGKLRTNRHILKRNLKEFLNIEKLNPKVSIEKVFQICEKVGFKNINEFELHRQDSKLIWSIYNHYKNGTNGIDIDAKTGKILNRYSNQVVEKPE